MEITNRDLERAGVRQGAATRFVAALNVACQRFAIVTPARVAAFLAQCEVESGGFEHLSENLNYTTATRLMRVWPSRFPTLQHAALCVRNPERLANIVYAGRLGNGASESGDGWRFRGRGLIQLTGRRNYGAAAMATTRPYLDNPGLLSGPADAALAAAWFWERNGCNALADAGNVDAITRKVNGPAMLEAAGRRQNTAKYLRILSAA